MGNVLKTGVNIGSIGHVDNGKTTLSKAVAAELAKRSQAKDMSELKPSPFCGSTDIEIVTECGVLKCSRCNARAQPALWNA
jgi:translation elongation factor EF-Tu-like GTPase